MSNMVPKIVIRRLPLYLRTLERIAQRQQRFVSSRELAKRLGFSSAQIRKDLSHFGEFGKQGTGYNVAYLQQQLSRILQVDQKWSMAIVGAGDLGHALINYAGFRDRNFDIKAVFDIDRNKIGRTIGQLQIEHVRHIPQRLKRLNIKIGIIAVPARAGQQIAELLIEGGVRAILNYAPITLNIPPEINIEYIDPILALQSMTYYLERDAEQVPEYRGEATLRQAQGTAS
ncbi:MAG: redox-sensing transcriptional repressor Rex [Ardenticatenaceae bacterium]